MLPGNVHFSSSVLIAAMRGTAGSVGDRVPSARILSTSTVGTKLGLWNGPALRGRISGDGVALDQAPRGGSSAGEGAIRRESEVLGLGLCVVVFSDGLQ